MLPGTGGLTRLTDKRKVRRDLADVFCATEEGARGQRALDWRLVDEIAPPSSWDERVRERATGLGRDLRPPARRQRGIALPPLDQQIERRRGSPIRMCGWRSTAQHAAPTITVLGPEAVPRSVAEIDECAAFWPLAMARELDDAILHLRFNEPELGIIVLPHRGRSGRTCWRSTRCSDEGRDDWFVREVRLYWKRVLKRIDMTARSLFALIEPGSCFAGILAELVFAADRALMFAGTRAGDNREPPMLVLSRLNFGAFPMGNGLSRLATRFLGEPESLDARANKQY